MPTPPFLSIIIPVYNGGSAFVSCLKSIEQSNFQNWELIVVDDGSTDNSAAIAQRFTATVLKTRGRLGPGAARNLGSRAAKGDVLFFVDADVTVGKNTLAQVALAFRSQPDLSALIGSYDDAPGAPNFLSQYKNLFHHYTHQTACEEASTFWGACGAIRRDIFLTMGGFDEVYCYPSIEDIELGYRLKRAGYRIQLFKTVQVKHLKRWEVGSLLRAEFFYRALPWTELLWRDRHFTNDLNLKTSSRVSLLLTYGIVAALVASVWWTNALVIGTVLGAALLTLNLSVYRFFHHKRGFWFALKVIPWHWLYFLYGGLAFALGTARYHLFLKRQLNQISFLQS